MTALSTETAVVSNLLCGAPPRIEGPLAASLRRLVVDADYQATEAAGFIETYAEWDLRVNGEVAT